MDYALGFLFRWNERGDNDAKEKISSMYGRSKRGKVRESEEMGENQRERKRETR